MHPLSDVQSTHSRERLERDLPLGAHPPKPRSMESNLVEVHCPICDQDKYRVMHESTLGESLPDFGYKFTPEHLRAYRIVKCLNCDHMYCSPLPNKLFEQYVDIEDTEYLRNEAQRLATAEKVTSVLSKHKTTGRLLDVGCATGDFLRVARRHYEVEGIELSKWAAGIAQKRGLRVHECRLSELRPAQPYDVVTLWGVIEHLESPKDEIGQISRLMADGGILCIWTGNVDSLTARLLGKKWWYFMGQHIQYFSDKTLHLLLTQCGFGKVALTNYPYVLNMASVANSIGRYRWVSQWLSGILKSRVLSSATLTFALPGEMFAIYSKGQQGDKPA